MNTMIRVHNNLINKSARKVRAVCNLIRNKPVSQALKVLRYCEKREISIVLTKLLNSGLDIALKDKKMDLESLIVDKIFANEGPTMKRIMPRAQGRAYRVRHRTSKVTVELKEK